MTNPLAPDPVQPERFTFDGSTVADAAPNDWTRHLPELVRPFAQLARWDRPIGWWLLLWPCWWSVALALNAGLSPEIIGRLAPGFVTVRGAASTLDLLTMAAALLALFWIGAVAMRGAGCTWNDISDRHLDAGVARTRSRPLPSGRVRLRGAFAFLVLQLLIGLIVLLTLAAAAAGQWPSFYFAWEPLSSVPIERLGFVLLLGALAVPVVIAYPFAKRVTDWPQIVLGLAFSWGALMGWAVMFGSLGAAPILLYAGCIAWTVGYDTIYAHQDREDDALMGIRSTARLFGERTVPSLIAVYSIGLALFAAAFAAAGVHPVAWVGLVLAGLHMARQIARLNIDDAAQCLALFRSNTQIGWLVFLGLMAGAFARML